MVYKLSYKRGTRNAIAYFCARDDVEAIGVAKFSWKNQAFPKAVISLLKGEPDEIELINTYDPTPLDFLISKKKREELSSNNPHERLIFRIGKDGWDAWLAEDNARQRP